MNRKQFILVAVALLVTFLLIVASALWRTTSEEDERIQVVATFYPLVPYNSELHSWQPAPQDLITADRAEIILYNGGPADAWLVDDILPSIGSEDKLVVNTTQGVEFITGGEQEGQVDPHTWLSPFNARMQAENVYNALCEVDPPNASYFKQRFEILNLTLTQLHTEYGQLANGTIPGIIVSHAAFGYVAHEYGFQQYGAIGLSADEEPSANTLAELVGIMQNESIYSVYVDPVYRQDYATVLKNELESLTGHQVQVLDLFLMLGPYQDLDYLEQLSMNLVNLKVGLGLS